MIGNEMDWGSVVGVLGALGGMIIGAYATYKIQERQLEHSDATRFQEQRMQTYTRFTAAANRCAAHWSVGANDIESFNKLMACFENVRMIGSETTFLHAHTLQNIVTRMHNGNNESKSHENITSEFNSAVIAFVQSAREELKIKNA